MNSRVNTNANKKGANHTANNNINVLIERLKKIRALNGNPCMFGSDNYIVKSMRFNKFSIFTRVL